MLKNILPNSQTGRLFFAKNTQRKIMKKRNNEIMQQLIKSKLPELQNIQLLKSYFACPIILP